MVLHGREGHGAGMELVWLVSSSASQNPSRTTATAISITSSFTWLWGDRPRHGHEGRGCPISSPQPTLVPAKPGCGCPMPTLPARPFPAC